MWWSDPPGLSRRALILGALCLPAACGFRPVHAPDGPLGQLAGRVAVEAPATDAGFVLRNRIVDRLGAAGSADYHLTIAVTIGAASVAVTTEQVTTRFSLPGSAAFVLTRLSTGAVLAEGEVTSFSSYSATGTAVSTFGAAADAERRLAISLADQILLRLAAVTP